ncbi:hypothetical protein KCMC57_64770 (plasmid) [Kitasatospora sp. CMC57]|uniref:Uncharacterized protein n=1 Tax=Kitasatospora sp. CMC57 TaxID=3231513 RepID=A0AB33K9G3_9ACTN
MRGWKARCFDDFSVSRMQPVHSGAVMAGRSIVAVMAGAFRVVVRGRWSGGEGEAQCDGAVLRLAGPVERGGRRDLLRGVAGGGPHPAPGVNPGRRADQVELLGGGAQAVVRRRRAGR